MQQFFDEKKAKLNSDTSTAEYYLRNTKDNDCDAIRGKMSPSSKDRDLCNNISYGFAVIAFFLSVGLVDGFFNVLILTAILSFVGHLFIKYFHKSFIQDKINKMETAIKNRESQFQSDLKKLNENRDAEEKKIANEINVQMNRYAQTYMQSTSTNFLVDWLLNAFSIQLSRADRSPWLPQVKASIRFNVNYNKLCVPGYGDYNMADQGFKIDNNPLSVSALAYVLEKKMVVEAQRRFGTDQNGGKAVITSNWDKNISVDIYYTAPNGGVNVVR